MKNARYLLTGLIMTGLLVAAVLLVKKYQPVSAVKVSSLESKTKGPQNAPVQIIEYSDFQCPACARVEPIIKKLLETPEFSGKVHFVYRHFPLSGHRWSGLAHQAAECANDQGKFWEYHDMLYTLQAVWSEMESPAEDFIRYAKELGLKMDSFGFCLANPEVHQRVMKEKKMGEALQLRSTPTFFINGERVVGPVELEMRAAEMIRKILGIVPAPAPSNPSPEVSVAPEVPVTPLAAVSPTPSVSPVLNSESSTPAQ